MIHSSSWGRFQHAAASKHDTHMLGQIRGIKRMMNPNGTILWGQDLRLDPIVIGGHVQIFHNNMEITGAFNNSNNY